MPRLQYGYFQVGSARGPWAPAVAINTLNGKSHEFLGVLDTGSDQVSLSEDILLKLDIDRSSLLEVSIGGVEGLGFARFCDFVKIGLIEVPSLRNHFPNGVDPVPCHFSRGPF